MNGTTMEALVRRLQRVERQNQRLRSLAVVVLAGITLLILMGQANPSKIAVSVEAKRFVLRDGEGRIRASLEMWENGPRLVFVDKGGNDRMQLGTSFDGWPALGLADDKGNYNVELRTHRGGPELKLSAIGWDYAGDKYKTPIIPEPDFNFSALSASSSGLSLTDRFGTVRARLSLSSDGSPEMKLVNVDQKIIWSAP